MENKKISTTRKNSRLDFILLWYNEGEKTVEGLANKLKATEDTGVIKLKSLKDKEKDIKFYKKTVAWYLDHAVRRGLITDIVKKKRIKKVKEESTDSSIIPTL